MTVNPNQRIAVVTGSSSGIGREISLTLARNGFLTYATMRNLNKKENIKSVAEKENLPVKIVMLDVTDDRYVKDAVKSIIAEANRIDVLVNNAPYGLVGAFEDLAMEEIKSQYETNLFGVIRVTQAIIPVMRKQKSGTIINIRSGVVTMGGQPGGSAYVSTKFAVEGLSKSIAYELEPFGIKVVLVEPGLIKTNLFNNSVVASKSQDVNSLYTEMMRKLSESFEKMLEGGSSADVVAKVVLKAAYE